MVSILSNPTWGKRKTRTTSKGTKIVATKNVNIDIIAKDKTRQAMQSATKGVDGLKSAVFNLRNALRIFERFSTPKLPKFDISSADK